MRSASPILLFSILALSAGACDGGVDHPLGTTVNVIAPDPAQFPDDDPFEFCHYVRVCFTAGGKEDCKTVLEVDGTAALEPLPFGDDVMVCLECLPVVDNAGTPMPGEALSGGCTPPFSHTKSEAPESVNLFMQKLNTTMPPVDILGSEAVPTVTRWGAAVQVMYDDRILIAGGAEFKDGCTDWDGVECLNSVLNTAETFDPATGQFAPVGFGTAQLLSQARAFATAAELPSGEIAFFGGIGDNKEALSTVEIYDPFSGTFKAGPSMQFARAWHSATVFSDIGDGFILLAGGFGSGSDKYEIWNKTSGTVGSGVLKDGARWRHTTTLIQGIKDSRDKIVIAGGEDDAGVKSTYEIFDLSLQTPSFDPVPYDLCLSENEKLQGAPAKAKTMHAAALVPGQKFLYFVGGFSDITHDNPTTDICVWNVKGEVFNDDAGDNFRLQIPRGGLTATTLPGNVVLLAGGLTSNNTTAGTYETIFEYINQTHSKVIDVGPPAPLVAGRWDHSSSLLSDGRVLLLGGIQVHLGAYQAVTGAELYKAQ
ncbi:MAG: kelch repeat-containing protein [Pseudomonadota bacterium]